MGEERLSVIVSYTREGASLRLYIHVYIFHSTKSGVIERLAVYGCTIRIARPGRATSKKNLSNHGADALNRTPEPPHPLPLVRTIPFLVGWGSVAFACKREATPIKTILSTPRVARMVTA